MSEPIIKTVEDLRHYLYLAMKLEHATIPPYLLALYSIHPGTNLDATQVLRVVVVEEMLHLTLAANLLNAVGGTPNLTIPGFLPDYPTYLPDGEHDFQVPLQGFSKDAVLNSFLKIERPAPAPNEGLRMLHREPNVRILTKHPFGDDLHFYSIGEFYREIQNGFKYLYEQHGKAIFTGSVTRQVTAEYFYSGGGKVVPVTDIQSAFEAIDKIVDQGEGFDCGVYDGEGEMAHYYRFQELVLGKYYEKGNSAGNPTGPAFQVNWENVYIVQQNAKVCNYDDAPELKAAAVAFNQQYSVFLSLLTSAYNGMPELLLKAVPHMFTLRNAMLQLIHNPMPGFTGRNASPTFEMTPAGLGVPE
jgi:hypothetical protein